MGAELDSSVPQLGHCATLWPAPNETATLQRGHASVLAGMAALGQRSADGERTRSTGEDEGDAVRLSAARETMIGYHGGGALSG